MYAVVFISYLCILSNEVFEVIVFAQDLFADDVVEVDTFSWNKWRGRVFSKPSNLQCFLEVFVVKFSCGVNRHNFVTLFVDFLDAQISPVDEGDKTIFFDCLSIFAFNKDFL